MSEAVGAVATGAVTIASRDVQLNGVDVREGKWLGLADGVPVAGGESFDEVAQRGARPAARRAARAADALDRRRRAGARRPARARSPRLIPSSSSRCTRAASRTISCCWRPSDRLQPVRVVLVEDNDIFRETLELLFGLREEIEVVASVAPATRRPTVCSALEPDVVLMDYRMPGLNGAEATRAVLTRLPDDARRLPDARP